MQTKSEGIFISKKVISFFVILLVFLLGGLSMYLYQTYGSGFSLKRSEKIGSKGSGDDTQTVPKGWKVYRSEETGVSVAYPTEGKEVVIDEDKAGGLCNEDGNSLVTFRIYPKGYPGIQGEPLFGGDLLFAIYGFNNDTGISARDWILKYCSKYWPTEEMSSLPAKRGEAVKIYAEDPDKRILVGLNTGSHLFFFRGFSVRGGDNAVTIFTNMLNSFQFKE